MGKNLYYNKKTKKFQDTPTVNQYGLPKINEAQIERNSQKRKAENAAKEAQWAKARQAREAEKQTESYKRQKAATERHNKAIQLEVRQSTEKFNANSRAKAQAKGQAKAANTRSSTKTKLPALERDVVKRYTPIGSNHNYSNFGYAYKSKELTDEGKLQKWLNPSYKLNDREKLEAKDLIKKEQARRTSEIRKGNQDLMIPGTNEYNRYKQFSELEAKTKNAGTRGFLLPFLKATNAVVKGTEKLTGTENTKAAKALNEQLERAFRQDEQAAGQSPIRHGIGNFAGAGAMYAATNPAFDAAAAKLGVTSTAGKILANQAAQNAQDIVLDTLPEYQRLKDQGLSDSEIRKEITKNVAWNVAGNAAMQGLSDFVIPKLGQKLGKNKSADIPKVEEPTIKEIEKAVKKQTDETKKVLKESEPIEQWTKNQLKAEPIKQDIPKGEEPKVIKTPKPTESPAKSVSYTPETIEKALDTVDNARIKVQRTIARNTDKLTETAKKNVNRFNKAADALDDAIKRGADTGEIQTLNKEMERAYGALHKNLQAVGVSDLRSANKDIENVSMQSLFGKNSESNIDNIMSKGVITELPEDAEGFIDTDALDLDDLPFNDEPIYDAGGHVLLDDEGIPKQRQGVNVNIRNTANLDANYGDDVLTAERRLSKVRGNTLEYSGIDNADELQNVVPEDQFYYTSQPEQVTYEAAQAQLDNDWDGSIAKYTKDYDEDAVENIRSAQDIDAMMLARQRINEEARAATDPQEKRNLYSTSRKIALNLRKAGTKGGQAIQAFAKWTRTAEGAITSAQGFAEDMVEKELKKNPKMAKDIKEVGKEIENFLDQMEVDALSREEIEKMIDQAILRRGSLRKRITKGDIRQIADSIMNDRQYADIQSQLEFLSTGYMDIDAETLDRVQEIFDQAQGLNFNSKERVDLENEAYKLLANKIVPKGGTIRDKIDAWRYLAMLANPTTHIKNMTGNELFGQGMVSAKNTLAAMIEEAADRVSKATGGTGIDRSKAILTRADQPLIEAAGEDALQNAYRELSGNKYFNAGSAIDNAIPAFNTQTRTGRFLNKVSDLNTNLLNKEDESAVLAKYRTSLAGFLKANGADASIFNATDDASKSLLESGREYAIRQAKEAAFHQDSATSNALSQFSKTSRNSDSKALQVLGFGADVVVPFKKTPINILKSAIEYSPAEYVKVVGDVRKLNKGVMKPAEFIDDISKATTGTAALGIGALLAHEGIVRIGSSKSDEEQAFDKQTGRQNVAIKVGNRYVELSELIPAAAPIILGGTIYDTIAASNGEENALNTIFSGLSAISNGVTDMTMLSGIADTLNSVRYAKDKNEVWQQLGIDTMGNLASQMLPTLGRKLNTTIDDTARSTYSDQTGALKTIDQEAKYLQTKIPGLQQVGEAMQGSQIPFLQNIGNRLALQPNIDVKGQIQESQGFGSLDNFFGRALANFVSPVKITEDESTVYDDERRRIANATGETKVLPYIASSEANIPNVGQLTPEQWTQYRQQRGQLREQLATAIMSQDQFKSLSDVDKAEYLADIDSFTKAYTQSQFGKELSETNQKLADVYERGGVDALITRMQQNKELNKAGLKATDKILEYLDNGGTIDNYLTFSKKITSLSENGNPTVKKSDFMSEIARMPRDQQDLFFNTRDVSLTKKEQEAYDKGGAQAVVDTWKQEKAEKEQKAKEKAQKKREQAKKANMSVEKMESVQEQLAAAGAIDSPTTVEYYDHARQTIPSLTPKSYANYLHQIGGNDYKITQKEMLSYANNNSLSESDMTKYWNAFGKWKKIPYLKNGTWKAK